MANKALQEIKAYAKYYYSNSTEIFNSTLPISSPTTLKAPDQFICKQSKLEAPEIYLPKEDLIHNDGYEFLGNIHYDDYPL